MNARILALLLFAGWSALCWYWYVCQIKQVCGQTATASAWIQEQPSAATPEEAGAAQTAAPEVSAGSSVPQQDSPPDIRKVNIFKSGEMVRIHFPYNAVEKETDPAVDAYLQTLAEDLIRSGRTATIAGHTDGVGDAASNMTLALERARSIAAILKKKGVPAAQIKAVTYGKSKPIDTNDHPQGRYQNRRVEITVQ